MCEHEAKQCPECKRTFECKAGSILLCQCSAVTLNQNERDYLASKYSDCLCAECMIKLRTEYNQALFKKKIYTLLGLTQ